MTKIRNRWAIAAAAMSIQACLGSVYAWSVIKAPIKLLWNTPHNDEWMLNIAFSLAIGFLGLTAAFAGSLQQKIGPRKSILLSCLLFCGGMLATAGAIHLHSFTLLYACYGVIGGIGLGLGYAPPVMTLVKWFPDRKGLATGLAVGGFGLGSLIAAKGIVPLLASFQFGPAESFALMAVGYAAIILFCSRWMILPPEGYAPPNMPASSSQANGANSIHATQAIKTPSYKFLWLVFFINISLGIPLIANGKGMAESSGFSPVAATTLVGIMGLLNGSGRIIWSALSDKIGRLPTWFVMLAVEGLIFTALGFGLSGTLFAIAVCTIMSTYGGGFALVPAHTTDLFGPAEASKIYGTFLTAWSAGAMISTPAFDQLTKACGGDVTPQLWVCVGLSVLAILMATRIKPLLSRPS